MQNTEVRDLAVHLGAQRQTDPAEHQQGGERVTGVGQGAQH